MSTKQPNSSAEAETDSSSSLHMSASKNDTLDCKPDYSLVPRCFMDQVSYCMMAGAKKYGEFNYLKGHRIRQLTAAATRHLKHIEAGDDIDTELSASMGVMITHAAAVAANMLMLLHQEEAGTLYDDRH